MSNKEKFLAAAQKNLAKGQVAKAVKDYKKVVELDPKDVRNRQKLAELCVRAKMPKEAQEHYEGVARFYAENGFYLKSIAVYKQIQRLDPSRVDVYHRLADLNAKQGLVGNALAEYKTLASHYEKDGLLPEAINILQKMKEIDPENLNIRVKIAETYGKAGLAEKSLAELRELFKLLRGKGEVGKILKLYEIFLPLFPNELELQNGYARALVEKGEAGKGLGLLQNLLKKHPGHPELLRNFAFACQRTGDHQLEIETYRTLLAKQPSDLQLRQGFIRACLRGQNHQQALDSLEEWKEDFFDAQRADLLKEFYEKLREALPQDPRALETLKNIYQARGEGDKLLDLMSLTGEDTLGGQEASLAEDHEILDAPIFEEAERDLADEVVPEPEVGEEIDESAAVEDLPLEFLEEDDAPTSSPDAGAEARDELEVELELDGDPFADLAPAETPQGFAADEEAEAEEDLGDLELIELPDFDAGAPQQPESTAETAAPDVSAADEGSFDEIPELEFDFEQAFGEMGAEEVKGAETPLPDFQEVDFFLQQGMVDEAQELCRRLAQDHPGAPAIEERLREIDRLRKATRAAPAKASISQADKARLDGDFSRFKKSLESQIDEGDAETHFNLGIAYKEMGLLDDAVNEFDQAMKNSARRLDSLTLKGICLKDKGDFEGAEESFKSALLMPGIQDETLCNLYFELGLLQENQEQYSQALQSFERVAERDGSFRDVADKLQELRRRLGIKDDGPGGDNGRVSYV